LFENKLEEIHDLKTKAIELMLEEDKRPRESPRGSCDSPPIAEPKGRRITCKEL